ncbi:MAG: hypothetical protein QHH06_15210 [Clostridiales bacterium]|nr:hypothetical protein [Eubacteriales bacterium]MDH7567783.1 hypothetical protein [Clostridiales bacterium]
MKGNIRNWAFLVLLLLVCTGIAVVSQLAEEQNKLFLKDYEDFRQAKKMLQAEKYNDAYSTINTLFTKYPDSYELAWNLGLCLSAMGQLPEGESYMVRAREMNPSLVLNDLYLLQYGQVEYNLKKYDVAKRYFERVREYSKDKDKLAAAEDALKRISNIP